MSKAITESDLQRAADDLAVPLPTVKAVRAVESAGKGFLADGRPVILYERHIMRRRLREYGVDPAPYEKAQPSLVNATPGGYQGGVREHERLDQAAKIHRESALESCSWGLFQIMGFHWKLLGYPSLQSFVNAMYRSEGDQLDAFVRFVKANPSMHKALKRQDWTAFATAYNGPAQKGYDKRLAAAFKSAGGSIA
ncbi:hypothetical protein D3C76_48190 [compost metagenome]